MNGIRILLFVIISVALVSDGYSQNAPGDCEIWIPNCFTPDGDGVNEQFFVITECEYLLTFEMKIFDSQGGLVYELNDKDEKWDGSSLKSETAVQGMYNYILKYRNLDQEKTQEKFGRILLLR